MKELRFRIPEPDPEGTVDEWITHRKLEIARLWGVYSQNPDMRAEIDERMLEVRLDLMHLLRYRQENWRRD
jgi:hypothetical protein